MNTLTINGVTISCYKNAAGFMMADYESVMEAAHTSVQKMDNEVQNDTFCKSMVKFTTVDDRRFIDELALSFLAFMTEEPRTIRVITDKLAEL